MLDENYIEDGLNFKNNEQNLNEIVHEASNIDLNADDALFFEDEKDSEIIIENNDEVNDTKVTNVENYLVDCQFLYNKYINLAKQNLSEVPESILKLHDVERINLEGNEISKLPENLFECLPNLKWLDLRCNKLKKLPTIGLDNDDIKLEVLLLENNQITCLPVELAKVHTLKALNARHNPIEFPPEEIAKMGFGYIKAFLLNKLDKDFNNNDCNNSSNNNNFNSNFNHNGLISAKISKNNSNRTNYYRDKLLKKSEKSNQKKSLRTQSEKYLTSTYGQPIPESVVEEKFKLDIKDAKKKNLLEKQNSILQARKDQEVKQNWKEEYKKLQSEKLMQKRMNGGYLDFEEPVTTAPFDYNTENLKMISNEERIFRKMNRERIVKPKNLSIRMKMQLEAARLNHERFLKNKVAEQLKSMKNRRYSGMTAEEIMMTAKMDLDITLKLKDEIQKRKREIEFRNSNLPKGLNNDV